MTARPTRIAAAAIAAAAITLAAAACSTTAGNAQPVTCTQQLLVIADAQFASTDQAIRASEPWVYEIAQGMTPEASLSTTVSDAMAQSSAATQEHTQQTDQVGACPAANTDWTYSHLFAPTVQAGVAATVAIGDASDYPVSASAGNAAQDKIADWYAAYKAWKSARD